MGRNGVTGCVLDLDRGVMEEVERSGQTGSVFEGSKDWSLLMGWI